LAKFALATMANITQLRELAMIIVASTMLLCLPLKAD